MARQMKAERDKRAAILVAEGERQAAILTAEGAKQAQILAAEGRREAAYRDAEARERSAEAEAKATQVVSEAISKGNVQAINYFVANNYIGALKALAEAKNQKVLILPLEATSVIGAIAGVGRDRARGVRRPRRQLGLAAEPGQAAGDHDAAGSSPAAPFLRSREPPRWSALFTLGPWNWMILAAILFVLEVMSPGIFLMWFGMAAAVTGADRLRLRHRLAVAARLVLPVVARRRAARAEISAPEPVAERPAAAQ